MFLTNQRNSKTFNSGKEAVNKDPGVDYAQMMQLHADKSRADLNNYSNNSNVAQAKNQGAVIQKADASSSATDYFTGTEEQLKGPSSSGGAATSSSGGTGGGVGTKPSPKPKDTKLTLATDKEAEFPSKDFIVNGNVGHTWIMLDRNDGTKDSYGFWPKGAGSGGGFNMLKPWKSVEGEVRHPDESHTPNAKLSIQIDEDQLKKGEDYAMDKASVNYNLLTYNCTHFAREFFKISTGIEAPFAGMLIESPNALFNSIEEINGTGTGSGTK